MDILFQADLIQDPVQFFIRQVAVSRLDVVEDASADEPAVLEHHAHPPAQLRDVQAVHADVVVVDHAGARLFKAQQQPQKRGLAAAGPAGDRHVFPRSDVKVDVPEHGLSVFLVGEADPVDVDLSRDFLQDFAASVLIRLHPQDIRRFLQGGQRTVDLHGVVSDHGHGAGKSRVGRREAHEAAD